MLRLVCDSFQMKNVLMFQQVQRSFRQNVGSLRSVRPAVSRAAFGATPALGLPSARDAAQSSALECEQSASGKLSEERERLKGRKDKQS